MDALFEMINILFRYIVDVSFPVGIFIFPLVCLVFCHADTVKDLANSIAAGSLIYTGLIEMAGNAMTCVDVNFEQHNTCFNFVLARP